jgi:hypothetical protein
VTTTISAVEAAAVLGMDTYTLARHLRQEAAIKLRRLAADIERGSGDDIDADDYADLTQAAWRLVESSKPCDAAWIAELGDEDSDAVPASVGGDA